MRVRGYRLNLCNFCNTLKLFQEFFLKRLDNVLTQVYNIIVK